VDSVVTTVIGDIALVFLVSSLLAAVARRCGQPAVIGQILTGVLLGPSLLGRLPGHLSVHLFPHQVIPYLTVLSQVAVVIFMFAVGYEIEFRSLRGHGRAVSLVAAGALAIPMALGIACVLLFRPEFAAIGEGHQGRSFVLFMGAATSITALPVLAAIVRERGLAGTTPGVIATASAGIMDVLAWLVLAAALTGTGRSARFPWLVTLLLIGCFAAVMLGLVRPAVSWWTNRRQSVLSSPVPVAFALAMGSAWVTASLGLHPVFGAFLAGLTMRGNRAPDADVLRSMEQTGGLLLPLFFVVTGLSLNVGSVDGNALVLLALIVVIASVGKLGPGYAISRACGLPVRESATIAALVNTRGLTELIALNVGLVNGIIDQRLFAILVLMALITTLMTGPFLSVIRPVRAPRPAADEYIT
jgi:Kef-type K+ transport system membrane component KefB